MLERTTISVPNLAARWSQTPSDILEHAANLRLHLLFNFDGLVFDLGDDWLPGGKDWIKRSALEALTDFVKRADAKFKRRVNGQLSQWKSLDSDEAVSLRAEVTAKEQEIQALNELFDDRDRKRQQKHYRGALMAAPATVDELLRLGFANHPIRAYRPEGPFYLRKIDGVPVLDGPIVRLEAGAAQWKERLEPSDMVVSMADVKAIEAAAKPQQTAPATDTVPEQEAATPATVVAASDSPAPLTRNEIASCFAGLREWDEERWKKELSSPDDWLKACQQRKGTRGRGGFESTWWPVEIATALVDRNDSTVRMLRARFKNQEPLKPWLELLETYYPDDV